MYVSDIPGQGQLAEVITGVAIASTDSSLSVYFGCVSQPQTPGLGGAGLLHVLDKKIQPLTSNKSAVYAGSMFVTDICNNEVTDGVSVCQPPSLGILMVFIYAYSCLV